MKRYFILAVASLFLLIGCQKQDAADVSEQEGEAIEKVATPVVRAANGKMYAVSCLRDNATVIQSKGASAMEECLFDPETGAGRGFHQRGTTSQYVVYWPPQYYSPQSAYYYYYPTTSQSCTGSSCSTTGTTTYPLYGGTGYGSGYSGGSSSSGYNSDSFCSFVFGGSCSFNCYQTFGYSGTSWTKNYDDKCDHCMYAYNPSKCRNKCWKSYSWY